MVMLMVMVMASMMARLRLRDRRSSQQEQKERCEKKLFHILRVPSGSVMRDNPPTRNLGGVTLSKPRQPLQVSWGFFNSTASDQFTAPTTNAYNRTVTPLI
jgi:hypothetical protein